MKGTTTTNNTAQTKHNTSLERAQSVHAVEEVIIQEARLACAQSLTRWERLGNNSIEAEFRLDFGLESEPDVQTDVLLTVRIEMNQRSGSCVALFQALDMNPKHLSEVARRAEQLYPLFDRWHRLVTSRRLPGKLPESLLASLEQRALLIEASHGHPHRVHTHGD